MSNKKQVYLFQWGYVINFNENELITEKEIKDINRPRRRHKDKNKKYGVFQ